MDPTDFADVSSYTHTCLAKVVAVKILRPICGVKEIADVVLTQSRVS